MHNDAIDRPGANSDEISNNNFYKDSNNNRDDKSTNSDKIPEESVFLSKLKNKLRHEDKQLAEEEMNEDNTAIYDDIATEASL